MAEKTFSIFGVIGEDTTSAQVSAFLRSVEKDDHLTVRFNSPGGYAIDGMAIYSLLKQHPAQITGVVDGACMSAAVLPFMACTERIVSDASVVMIHSASGMALGNADDIRQVADSIDGMNMQMARIISKATGISELQVTDWMDGETYFWGNEAVTAGLANKFEASDFSLRRIAACLNTVNLFEKMRAERFGATRAEGGKPPLDNKKEDEAMTDNGKPSTVAATFAELKAALIGASAEFICAMLAKDATLEVATAEWAQEQVTALARLESEKATALAELAELKAKGLEKPGVEPIGSQGDKSQDEPLDPIKAWGEAVAAEVTKGRTKAKAISIVASRDKDLHAAYIEAVNEKGR